MIATQTGSTAYSLSGGGSVLDPELDAFILTPICPMTNTKPIVFPSKCKIEIRVLNPKEISVIIDGQYIKDFSVPCTIKIARSENETKFIRFNGGFYDRLRARLLFQGDYNFER